MQQDNKDNEKQYDKQEKLQEYGLWNNEAGKAWETCKLNGT